jgi:chromosome segregation ATPase
MQSQLQQLGEARRQDRESGTAVITRIEDLDQRVAGWQSQLRDGDERHRALAARIGELYEVDDAVRGEIRKLGEDLQVEKQNMRRQVVESQQLSSDLRPLIDAQMSRIERLEDIRQRIDTLAVELPPQIAAVVKTVETADGEIKRVERLATERFLMNQERLEEIRRQQDDKYRTLEDADDSHLRQTTAWIERSDSWVRELEQRIARAQIQIEELRQRHSAHLNDLEQHDLKLADAMTVALKGYIEAIRAEQVEHGRAPQE